MSASATECKRLDDEYVPPRYPVDEPPTYRARCACGWVGAERYAGITDGDWRRHDGVRSLRPNILMRRKEMTA